MEADNVGLVSQKYTGKEFEALTGLYAFGARWFDAELGIWLGPDPAHTNYNPYSYVSGDPMNFTDPDGLYPCNDSPDAGECTQTCSGPDDDRTCNLDDKPSPEVDPVTVLVTVAVFGGGPALAVAATAWYFLSHDDDGPTSEQIHVAETQTLAHQNEPQDREKFDYYWNRGSSRIEQATVWVNGQAYIPYGSIPNYLGGYLDKARALSWYGMKGRNSSDNVAIGIFTGEGPGPVGELAGAGSSARLKRALEEAGHVRSAESAAHHIVASKAPAAAPARSVLERFGIGIDDAENGVFLPANRAAENAAGAAVHSTIYTEAYYRSVNQMLSEASTPDEAKAILDAIRKNLRSGGRGY